MRLLLVFAIAWALSSCAVVRFADGQRVAIEHDMPDAYLGEVQSKADAACERSGGKRPAVLISNLPLNDVLPSAMVKHTATYRCS